MSNDLNAQIDQKMVLTNDLVAEESDLPPTPGFFLNNLRTAPEIDANLGIPSETSI